MNWPKRLSTWNQGIRIRIRIRIRIIIIIIQPSGMIDQTLSRDDPENPGYPASDRLDPWHTPLLLLLLQVLHHHHHHHHFIIIVIIIIILLEWAPHLLALAIPVADPGDGDTVQEGDDDITPPSARRGSLPHSLTIRNRLQPPVTVRGDRLPQRLLEGRVQGSPPEFGEITLEAA
jgi:hypothetical protein